MSSILPLRRAALTTPGVADVPHPPDDVRAGHGYRSSAAAVMIGLAVVVHLALQSWAVIVVDGLPLTQFRTIAGGDQLGYMAISANIAEGQFDRSEPYTETGLNTYPRAYYTLIGLVARMLPVSLVTAWNLTGLVVQAAMIAVLAYTVVRLSGRPILALAAPIAFLVGPLAWTQTTDWNYQLESHSRLWGPYGVLMTLNAESAGLAIGVVALSLLALAWLFPRSQRSRLAMSALAAVGVGVTANGQTYSFISLVYAVAAVVSLWAILQHRRRTLGAVSALLFAAVYWLGPLVAETIGQLPTLLLGLVPFLPGLLLLLRRHPKRMLALGLLCVAAAMTQLWTTVSDLRSGDPFLQYRVASSKDLGVTNPHTLIAMAPVVLPLLAMLALAWRRRHVPVAAAAAAMLVTFPFAATNDVWGANAEPYRFWIDMFLYSSVVVVLGYAALDGDAWRAAPVAGTIVPAPAAGFDTAAHRRAVKIAVAGTAVLYALTLPDYARWSGDPVVSQTWNPHEGRAQAVAELARAANDGSRTLLITDACVDPQYTKVVSGTPIAYYRQGMAWPAQREAVSLVSATRQEKVLWPAWARRANLGWILTDSACSDAWLSRMRPAMTEVDSRTYEVRAATADFPNLAGAAGRQRLTLYRVR